MKSKSLHSLVDPQQQIFPSNLTSSSTVQIKTTAPIKVQETEKIKFKQQSSTKHRIYHLTDEKINDFIFIEETTPKIKILNNSKFLNNNNSNENLSKLLINRSNLLPNHNEMKFITASSNQLYQDQSSLFTVFSTTSSNIGLKITQQQPLQQQSSLISGSSKLNMIERSNSNSKYPNLHNSSSISRNNTQLTNEMKKFIPGRPLLNPNQQQQQQQQQQSIVSIVKPVISNIYLNKDTPNSAGTNPNQATNSAHTTNSTNGILINSVGRQQQQQQQQQQQSPAVMARLNRSSIIRSNTDRSPTALLSPVLYHQQQIAANNFYTSNNLTTQNSSNIVNINSNINNSNNNNDPFYNQSSSSSLTKQLSFNNNNTTSRNNNNKSPNLLTREKTSLSNYFTNIMNPNPSSNNNNNNNMLLINNNNNNNNYNNINSVSGKKLKQQQQQQVQTPQQQQQIFNSTITNNLINKLNSNIPSRNELSSSLSSNNNNINNMLVNFNNKITNGNSNGLPKHSNSFNFKYNLGGGPVNGPQQLQQQSTPLINNNNSNVSRTSNNIIIMNNIENDMITGVSLKSAAAGLRQKANSNTSINELNNTMNLNRNDSRLMESVIHEVADGRDSLNETGDNNNNDITYNGLASSRSNSNKFALNKKILKSKTLDKSNSFIKQASNITIGVTPNNYQPLMINSSKKFMNDDEQNNTNNNNNNKQNFDETLNFDNTGIENDIKYRNRHSRSSFKDTSAKIFGSIIMPSKTTPTLLNTNNSNPNVNANSGTNTPAVGKRHESARSYISRDVNDSYAYNDVKKYIEENDLMPPDRAEFIKLWIRDVNMCLKDLEQTVT